MADSGINPRDPQVGGVEGGIGLRFLEGRIESDGSWEDLLGHGTAVAATIKGHAPGAVLYSIRIFRRRLQASAESLLHAIDWSVGQKLDLLNLSLGCSNDESKAALLDALERAVSAGLAIVAPAEEIEMPGVVRVVADEALVNGEIRDERGTFYASPWARSRGELPRERNFHGTSFAVANVSGIAARLMTDDENLTAQELPRALSRLAVG